MNKIVLIYSSVAITDGGTVNASTFGEGNAGGINLTVSENISADGESQEGFSSGIFSTVDTNAVGDAGGIEINTANLTLTDGATVSASTFGQGNAEGISITTTGNISIEGTDTQGFSSGIFSTVDTNAVGDAGGIEINTANLTLTDGGTVNASTFGQGNAGEINLTAFDTISVNGKDNKRILTGIYSTVENTATGNASGIEIDTVNLNLINTGQISSSTFGQGNAGTIKINATDTIFADGAREGTISGIFSRVDEIAEGNSGGIEITAKNLTISNEAEINVGIFGKTNPELESGNLDLTVENLFILRNSSKISAQATGNNNGGNVTISADDGFIIAFPYQNNDIFANAERGNGGNINITTQAVFGLEERPSIPDNQTNDIDASSEFGLQGTLSLNTPDIDPTSGLIELPQAVTDPSDQISQNPCEQTIGSEFIITGKGGIPPSPHNNLSSDVVRVDLAQPLPSQSRGAGEQGSKGDVGANAIPAEATENSEDEIPEEIVVAQGWIFNDKGEVMLTSYDPTQTGVKRSWQNSKDCSVSQ